MSIQTVVVVRTVIDAAVEDEIRAIAARPAMARYHVRYLAFFIPRMELPCKPCGPPSCWSGIFRNWRKERYG